MKHINLDIQAPAVRDFFGSLPADPTGIALEAEGNVVWTLSVPDAERRRTLRERAFALIEKAQSRNLHADEEEVARVVAAAVAQVRGEESSQ